MSKNATGVITGWVLVHDGDNVILTQYNENQETDSGHNVEVFSTEAQMNARISSLGLTVPQDS